MIYIVEALLWILVAALGLACALRGRILFNDGLREGAMDFLRLLPKVMIGVIGSGYIAAIMPPEIIGRWLGPDSGFFGVLIAVIGGALTPGSGRRLFHQCRRPQERRRQLRRSSPI